MKNLLFLLSAAAIYLHFYPNEEVTKFYHEKKSFLVSKFNEMSDTKIRLKADKIYDDLEGDLKHFSDNEVERLKVITSSRSNVKDFYFTYCKTERRDVVFHRANENRLCKVINKYASLL